MPIPHTPRQQPVAAVMAFLIDQAEATARAIENNACEDSQPLDDAVARAWISRLDMISGVLNRASKTQRPAPPILRYAYFSAAAAARCGSAIYLNCDGEEIEVTCVGKDLIDDNIYLWPDRKSVKPVVEYVRKGQRDQLSFPMHLAV